MRVCFQKVGPIRITGAASVETKLLPGKLRPLPTSKTHNKTSLVTGGSWLGSKSETKLVWRGACRLTPWPLALFGFARWPLPPKLGIGRTTQQHNISARNNPKAETLVTPHPAARSSNINKRSLKSCFSIIAAELNIRGVSYRF